MNFNRHGICGGSVAEVDYRRGTDHTSTRLTWIQPFYRGARRAVKHGSDSSECGMDSETGGWVEGSVKLTLHNGRVKNCSSNRFWWENCGCSELNETI